MRERLLTSLSTLVVALGVAGCNRPPESAKNMEKLSSEQADAAELFAEGDGPEAKADAKPNPDTKKKPEPSYPEGVYIKLAPERGSCRRALCLGGPGELWRHAHFDLNEVCRRSRGAVQRCEKDVCTTVWPVGEWREALDALITSLDRDGDGKVTGSEAECPINLGGWSTGAALISTQFAAAYLEAVPGGTLENLLLVAPHTPEAEPGEPLTIDPHFTRAFVYRQTRLKKDDCTASFEGGPWTSPDLACGEQTKCLDYDYASVGDLLAYIGRRGNRTGWEIDSCSMSSFVAKIGLDNLDHGRESYSDRVPPYTGTETRGGRDPHPKPPGEGEGAPG